MAEVEAFLVECGLVAPRVLLDGRIHRVDSAKRGKRAGWYIAWEAPVLVCVAGDWATSAKHEWRERKTLTRAEGREVHRLMQQAAEAAAAAKAKEQEDTARQVRLLLAKAAPATADHPYLAAKRVRPHGILCDEDMLLIPNRDVSGTVWGAQRIFIANGKTEKLWYRGQRCAETFYQIGEIGGRAYICEGFATGATIYETTGDAAFCAFSTGQLKSVAKALRGAHPQVEWVIAADNDRQKKKNTGLEHAIAAAREIGCLCAVPEFSGSDGTDFNDLMCHEGAEAVKRQLQGARAPMSSVTQLPSAAPATSASAEISQAEFFHAVVRKMIQHPEAPADWPRFPRRFHAVADTIGRKAILEELDDEIVIYRDKDVVADAILQYCWKELRLLPETKEIDAEKAAKARNMWLGLAPLLPRRPEALLELSRRGLTFKRLPFDAPATWNQPIPPVFDEFLSRCSDSDALCAFIGSLFYPDSDRQQYLYLFGEGGDGKGALMRLLASTLGAAAVPLTPPKEGDRFWNMKLYGKRLGVFFDCDDWKWFGSPHFKSLTGNDPLFFEEKGRPGFADLSDCKILAASNSKPQISSQKSDLRRLIFVQIYALPETVAADPTYEARLAAESEAIIRICKKAYEEQCPRRGPIPFVQPRAVALEAESFYLDIFHANFTVDPDGGVFGDEVRAALADAGVRSTQEMKRVKECWQRLVDGLVIDHSEKGAKYLGIRRLSGFERHERDGTKRKRRRTTRHRNKS